MTRNQEKKLAALAREAAELRRIINAAEAMLRSWRHRKKTPVEGPDNISLYLSDGRVGRWHASVDLPAAQVERGLMSVLCEIRTAASEKLQALKADLGEGA